MHPADNFYQVPPQAVKMFSVKYFLTKKKSDSSKDVLEALGKLGDKWDRDRLPLCEDVVAFFDFWMSAYGHRKDIQTHIGDKGNTVYPFMWFDGLLTKERNNEAVSIYSYWNMPGRKRADVDQVMEFLDSLKDRKWIKITCVGFSKKYREKYIADSRDAEKAGLPDYFRIMAKSSIVSLIQNCKRGGITIRAAGKEDGVQDLYCIQMKKGGGWTAMPGKELEMIMQNAPEDPDNPCVEKYHNADLTEKEPDKEPLYVIRF